MTKDEADDRLRQAIMDHAEAHSLIEPGEMLNEYAVVAHWQPVVEDGVSRYTEHYNRSPIPQHVAIGLFEVAIQHLIEGDEY